MTDTGTSPAAIAPSSTQHVALDCTVKSAVADDVGQAGQDIAHTSPDRHKLDMPTLIRTGARTSARTALKRVSVRFLRNSVNG